jgi:hypothetical protein
VLRPPVDIYEIAERITLYAGLPGVGKEQLNLRGVEGTSTIGSAPQEQMTALYAEVRPTTARATQGSQQLGPMAGTRAPLKRFCDIQWDPLPCAPQRLLQHFLTSKEP